MKIIGASSNRLPALAEDTIGPYYPLPYLDADRSDLTYYHRGLAARPEGRPILLRGHLLDNEGTLVDSAILEFWQANAAGVLRTPDNAGDPRLDPLFDGLGRIRTGRSPFEYRTIKPGSVAAKSKVEMTRAPHLTITIFSDGIARLVTQIFFDDEPANAEDLLLNSLPPKLRQRLIAKYAGRDDEGCGIYEIRIVMSGKDETPFFDDLTS